MHELVPVFRTRPSRNVLALGLSCYSSSSSLECWLVSLKLTLILKDKYHLSTLFNISTGIERVAS